MKMNLGVKHRDRHCPGNSKLHFQLEKDDKPMFELLLWCQLSGRK